MRSLLAFAVVGFCSMIAASAQVTGAGRPLDQALAQARAEAEAADAEVRRLGEAASKARGKAAQLQAERLAAAQAIAAAEARISAADASIRVVAARQSALTGQLQQQQQPISALLGGLAIMASRPPLISLASSGGPEELVRVRVLVDTTLPAIRARTAGLREQLSTGARLQEAAARARRQLQNSRQELASRKAQFAALEERALSEAASADSRAVEAGDQALAASDTAELLGGGAEQARMSAGIAAQLAREPAPPSAPTAAAARPQQLTRPPFPYILAAQGPVLTGLGTISASGVRARGIEIALRRGANVVAPAAGVVRFAGPYEDHDGVIIIDHGNGWISLIVNVASRLERGARIAIGASLGRALGPIEVELSHNGRRLSPALIAGSSAPLSNVPRDG
jgi:septal ring factor EnvC (AmiA/AmiB activator)